MKNQYKPVRFRSDRMVFLAFCVLALFVGYMLSR
jgi:hypothetical protein